MGETTILKTIIGLIIAIAVIVVLLNVMDKFLLFGKDKPDQQKDFFEELNKKIKEGEINRKTSQIFELGKNNLVISFNENQDSKINLKDIEEYSGNRKNQGITIRKPSQCNENCLCLCVTKDDNILFEDDCLQEEDLCINHEKPINPKNLFFLFGKGIYNLGIEKISSKTMVYIGKWWLTENI